MKVLLVDRSKSWLEMERRCLAAHSGRDIVTARTVSEAWSAWEYDEFDIVFIDVDWDDLSSIEFVREIREQYEHIPLILLTSEAGRSQMVSALRAGISDYLLKPCTPDAVEKRIVKWLACPV